MTLEEAIKHCEEKAEELENKYSYFLETAKSQKLRDEEKNCKECASEHRQLAKWLRELKGLREDENVKEVFKDCNTCKYESLLPDDYPCDRCSHRYMNQYVYDDKREVNADEDSD